MASDNACFALFPASGLLRWRSYRAVLVVVLKLQIEGHSSITYRKMLVPAEGADAGYIRQLQVVVDTFFQPIQKTPHQDTNNSHLRVRRRAPSPQHPAADFPNSHFSILSSHPAGLRSCCIIQINHAVSPTTLPF